MQLNQPKLLILISTNVLDMVLDLMEMKLLFPNGGFCQSVIIFGADMGSYVHVDKGPTQELDDTTLIAEKKYSIGFTVIRKQFI